MNEVRLRKSATISRRYFLTDCANRVLATSLFGVGIGPTTEEEKAVLLTGVVYEDIFKSHDTGSGHPESTKRYDAIMKTLLKTDFAKSLMHLLPQPARDVDIVNCHDKDYVAIARRDIISGKSELSTGDTTICPGSLKAALYAAGGACTAVDAVMEGKVKNVFCVIRPPGHHATPNRGMGFCIFNNAAIAARYAQKQHGIEKVLIVDWDVHHGNGTQDIFYTDDSVFFFSTHQSPLYPGTGSRDETGTGRGKGTTMNRPFPAGSGRKEIIGAFQEDLRPAVDRFKPDLVIVSAGFDSREDDPLGDFRLTDDDFAELTEIMMKIAQDHAGGRLISVLEGGYNLVGLASAAAAHCGRLHRGLLH